MTKTSNKCTSKEIVDLLESDDELPDDYEEMPVIPAYQNDNRFIPIRFEWLDKKQEDGSELSELSYQDSTDFFPSEPKVGRDKNMILISKGILTKRDIFFVKSIEEFSTDTTMLWFIEFLKYKSAQPVKSSCLVEDMFSDSYTDTVQPLTESNMRYYFKLVVK